MDEHLRFQQNLRGRRLAHIVVRTPWDTLPVLAPLASAALEALGSVRPGELRIVAT